MKYVALDLRADDVLNESISRVSEVGGHILSSDPAGPSLEPTRTISNRARSPGSGPGPGPRARGPGPGPPYEASRFGRGLGLIGFGGLSQVDHCVTLANPSPFCNDEGGFGIVYLHQVKAVWYWETK